MNARTLLGFGIGAVLAAGAAMPAAAQFYKGKTMTVVIGTRAGGNGDIQGRMVMRHLTKHIPGEPTVVVKNMAGSGGILATNFVAEVAKPDGLTVGYSIINIMAELLDASTLRASHKDLGFIGGLGSTSVFHIRTDTPPGVKSVADIFKIKETFRSAGHAPSSQKDLSIRVMCKLLELPCDHVTGFKSAGVIRRAIQQKEIQLTSDSVTGYFSRVEPTLIKPGISMPLWQYGVPVKGGGYKRDAAMPDVPTALEVYKMKHGQDAMPSGPDWQTYQLIVGSSGTMLRAVFLPPKAPSEPTRILREAFQKMYDDPAFKADWKKLTKADPTAAIGEEGAAYVKEVLSVTPEFTAYLKDFVAKGAK
jgi:tripartite-type tricarboxylate transporter receptor subunit TctC